MAAVVKVLFGGSRKRVLNITGVFSVSDETDTIVVDRSALTGPDGGTPTYVVIEELTWAVGAGFDSVMLEFDDGTDEVIEYLQGQGYMDYRPFGGKQMGTAPGAANEGDILLTTSGGAAGDTYSILAVLRLKD